MSKRKAARSSGIRIASYILTNVLVPLAIAIAGTAWAFDNQQQEQRDQGRALFNGIGYRYFAMMYDLSGESGYKKHTIENAERIYQATLADMQDDIRLLRTNPIYIEKQETALDLSILQNFLVMATIAEDFEEEERARNVLCGQYLNDDEWVTRAITAQTGIRQFAVQFCSDN